MNKLLIMCLQISKSKMTFYFAIELLQMFKTNTYLKYLKNRNNQNGCKLLKQMDMSSSYPSTRFQREKIRRTWLHKN